MAREFATLKRHDVYSAATGSYTANLMPFVYLKMFSEAIEGSDNNDYQIIMAALDIKDAFLQVAQEKLVGVANTTSSSSTCQDKRLGAKA